MRGPGQRGRFARDSPYAVDWDGPSFSQKSTTSPYSSTSRNYGNFYVLCAEQTNSLLLHVTALWHLLRVLANTGIHQPASYDNNHGYSIVSRLFCSLKKVFMASFGFRLAQLSWREIRGKRPMMRPS